MKKTYLPGVRSWLPWMGALLLCACASTGQRPDQLVAERAQARWDSLLSKDVEGAYGYFSPGYRSSFSLADYYRKLAGMRIRWTNAEVRESNCSEHSCKVRIYVDYIAYGAVPAVREFKSGSVIEEDWVLSEGEWYLLPGS